MKYLNQVLLLAALSPFTQMASAADIVTYHDCKNQDGSMSYRIYPCDKGQSEVRKFDVDLDKLARVESRKSTVSIPQKVAPVLATKEIPRSVPPTSSWSPQSSIDTNKLTSYAPDVKRMYASSLSQAKKCMYGYEDQFRHAKSLSEAIYIIDQRYYEEGIRNIEIIEGTAACVMQTHNEDEKKLKLEYDIKRHGIEEALRK